MEYQNRSVGDKIRYYSSLSKKGSRDKNGKLLSDFKRGECLGKSLMLSYCARNIKKVKQRIQKEFFAELKKCKPNLNERRYTDADLNALFDNLKEVDIFTNSMDDIV